MKIIIIKKMGIKKLQILRVIQSKNGKYIKQLGETNNQTKSISRKY